MFLPFELVFYRDPASAIVGTAGTNWLFPGNALTASTVKWRASEIDAVINTARWILVWTPGTNTSVQLSHADDGPANITEIASFTRTSPTPVVNAVDVSGQLNSLLAAGVDKQLCQRTAGNGSSGPKIYASWIEGTMSAKSTNSVSVCNDAELRSRIENLESYLYAVRAALS